MRYHLKAIVFTLLGTAALLGGCGTEQQTASNSPQQAAGLAGACPAPMSREQRTFNSPQDAVAALAEAVKQQDRAKLLDIFGPDAEQLKSGDPEQDREDAIVFARRLEADHDIRQDGPARATLLVGQERWPFAVPLVKEGSRWRFDTAAGLDEMTNRRIGRNELRTIAACRTLIDAEAQFYQRDPDGLGVKHYAQRLMSEEGKKNGLYWPAPGGVNPSPIGPALAYAAVRRGEQGERIPFNGYLFKPLHQQAASAPGGAMDYMQDGVLTRGWAIVAYPAEYGKTGIMSFLASSGGVVYQKDLGEQTPQAVEQIDSFDPSSGWSPVGESSAPAAGGEGSPPASMPAPPT